jgi:hypothetical protein
MALHTVLVVTVIPAAATGWVKAEEKPHKIVAIIKMTDSFFMLSPLT